MEEKQPLGFLFGSIAYFSEESIDSMISHMEKNSVPYLITQAIAHAHSKNAFTLVESEIISKCLRILNKEIYSYDDTTKQGSGIVEDN